jgi:aldehyde dehydrogenase (NAD+)
VDALLRNELTDSMNPATGELFARVQQAGKAETERAIAAAHKTYKAWAAMPVAGRETVVFRAADVLAAKAKEISEGQRDCRSARCRIGVGSG